jgi:periplasmic protein TonB
MAQPAAPSLSPTPPLHGDPLSKVWALGEREVRLGAILGFVLALVIHGAAGAQAAQNLYDMENFADAVKGYVKNNLQLQIEIDSTPPPPPPPPPEPPPPEPEPEKAPPPPPAAPNEPPPPPPAPAEAAKILTSEPDPDAPVDLTDQGIVSGEGNLVGGITANTGTSKAPVRDLKAQPGGVVGGTGAAPAPPPKPVGPDLSRAASPIGTSWSDCGFPAEAQLDGVEFGVVKLVVTVGADGRAKAVTVLSDPGSGFGSHARQCAMRRTFKPGLDKAGQAVVTTTPPFTVKFTL